MTVLCTAVKRMVQQKKTDSESWNHFTAKIMMGSRGFKELMASASLEKLSMSLLPLINNSCELNLNQNRQLQHGKKIIPQSK